MIRIQEKKIAVIGPTQSGKTCLAAGVYYVGTDNSEKLKVDVGEPQTKYWIKGIEKVINNQKWPGGNQKGSIDYIQFDFSENGKDTVRLEFVDVAGEIFGTVEHTKDVSPADADARHKAFKEFANAHLRELKGVVLLVNPGAKYFERPEDSMKIKAVYKDIINELDNVNSHNKKTLVALTITAADSLEYLSPDRRNRFERFVEEIRKEICNSKSQFECKKFYVSITGRLEQDRKPKFATNDYFESDPRIGPYEDAPQIERPAAPFQWIIKRLNERTEVEQGGPTDAPEPPIKKIGRYGLRVLLTSVFIALVTVAWCYIDASNEKNAIDRSVNACQEAVKRCRENTKPKTSDLDAVSNSFKQVRDYRGCWKKEYLAECITNLTPLVWEAYKKAIDRAVSDIAAAPGKEADNKNCNYVDELFKKFQPLAGKEKAEWEARKKDWEDKKPRYQEMFAAKAVFNDIELPLNNSPDKHGLDFIRFSFELYAKLCQTSPNQPQSIEAKGRISRELDNRTEIEWRKFAIPDFERNAANDATNEAVRDFASLLDAWKPATTNGIAAKAQLLTSVSNSISRWRTAYEERIYSDMVSETVRSRALESLAKLYPSRVETNEYRTAEYVSHQWNAILKTVYTNVYEKYIADFVRTISSKGGCPELGDRDRDRIMEKAAQVGMPFDKDKALEDVQVLLKTKVAAWENQKRDECEKWVTNEIKPGRKGHELVRAYIRERNRRENHKTVFNETIRREVYLHCEKCFERDIAFFKERYADKAECQKRFDDYFKPLCQILTEDAKDSDEVSWAIPFAKGCIYTGKIKDGFENAFKEEFNITSVYGKIDYGGSNPTNGFKGTRFGLEAFRQSDARETTNLIDNAKSPLVINNDNEWYTVSEEKQTVSTSFANPLNFGMNLRDVRNWERDYKRNYRDKDVQGFLKQFDPFCADASDELSIVLGGPFGKQTEKRKLAAYIRIDMHRVSGGGICSILSKAKESMRSVK